MALDTLFLQNLARLNFKAAYKTICCMNYADLYDFLAETGADPYHEPDQSRENYVMLALAHIEKNGPCIFLDWQYQGEI
jgi:hypothetical protein